MCGLFVAEATENLRSFPNVSMIIYAQLLTLQHLTVYISFLPQKEKKKSLCLLNILTVLRNSLTSSLFLGLTTRFLSTILGFM